MLVPAPITSIWALLVRVEARGLWQPSISSGELLSGEQGAIYSQYALNCDNPHAPLLVMEEILLSTPPTALQSVRHYPGLDCYTDYRLISVQPQSCQLSMRRRLLKTSASKQQVVSQGLIDVLDPLLEQQAIMLAAQRLLQRAETLVD